MGVSVASEELLPPERAFQAKIERVSEQQVHFQIRVAPGYYLYRDKFRFQLGSPAGDGSTKQDIAVELPGAHEHKFDTTFQKTLEVYRDVVDLDLRLPTDVHKYAILSTHYQGCADQGVCYPPMQISLALDKAVSAQHIGRGDLLNLPLADHPNLDQNSFATLWSARDDANRLSDLLRQLPLPYLMGGLLLLGVMLCFTPCVLPMVPIISAIILEPAAGDLPAKEHSRWRGLLLSSVYVLGMASTYIFVGVLTALMGASLVGYLQNPWVLAGFAILLLWMAGSLFGWFELRLPMFLRTVLDKLSGRWQRKKGIAGAVVMGMLSAVWAGSCMTPPLAGILLMIAHSGSPLIGGLLLFSLALGIGLPLILFGAGVGHWVPRTGPWMNGVKYFFGVLLVLLATWFMWPLSSKIHSYFYPSGQVNDLSITQTGGHLPFVKIDNLSELEHHLATARKPIMLDFFAEWCVSCYEMEQLTLSDHAIRQRLQNVLWLQVDVTENRPEHQQLMKRFALFGPPAILFFDANGQEQRRARVIGYQPVTQFQRTLDKAAIN